MAVRRPAVVVWAAASLVLVGCSALGGAGAAPTPTATTGAEVDVLSLAVGDCLDTDARPVTATVPVVDCDVEHDSEAYASIIVPGDEFPGGEAITAAAQTRCVDAFAAFAGIPYDESSLDYAYFFPTDGSWAKGDRRILCVIVDPGERVIGSLEGAAR